MKEATILSEDFNRLIATTKSFIAPPERKTLSAYHRYIKLDIDSKSRTLTAAASNGYALSVERAQLLFAEESFTVYIRPLPRFPVHSVTTIEANGKDVIIRNSGNIFGFEQPESKVPFLDYEQFFKRLPYSLRIGFNSKLLIDALRAEEISARGTSRTVAFELSEPNRPAFIRSVDDKSLRMVLPVRIKE